MERLQTAILKFYSHIEIHESKIDEIIKKVEKPCSSIVNQSAVLRAVLPENSLQGTPFTQFSGFRTALINKITAALEVEIALLKQIRVEICTANDELLRKQHNLESTFHELKDKNSIDLLLITPSYPALEHIVDWSSDVWRYYHSYYLQASQAVKTLNYEDEHSVSALHGSFQQDLKLKKYINEIRSYELGSFIFLT